MLTTAGITRFSIGAYEDLVCACTAFDDCAPAGPAAAKRQKRPTSAPAIPWARRRAIVRWRTGYCMHAPSIVWGAQRTPKHGGGARTEPKKTGLRRQRHVSSGTHARHTRCHGQGGATMTTRADERTAAEVQRDAVRDRRVFTRLQALRLTRTAEPRGRNWVILLAAGDGNRLRRLTTDGS